MDSTHRDQQIQEIASPDASPPTPSYGYNGPDLGISFSPTSLVEIIEPSINNTPLPPREWMHKRGESARRKLNFTEEEENSDLSDFHMLDEEDEEDGYLADVSDTESEDLPDQPSVNDFSSLSPATYSSGYSADLSSVGSSSSARRQWQIRCFMKAQKKVLKKSLKRLQKKQLKALENFLRGELKRRH